MMTKDIKFIIIFSILFLSLMTSNEFSEFIHNTFNSILLFIIATFLYQNKHYFITSPSFTQPQHQQQQHEQSSSSPILSSSNPNSPTHNNNNEIITALQKQSSIDKAENESLKVSLTDAIRDLKDLKCSIEKSKEEKLKSFNENNQLAAQIRDLKEIIKNNDIQICDLNNTIFKITTTLENQKQKCAEITKERDAIYCSEQKLLTRLTNSEKSIKDYLENEKNSLKKIQELKDQTSLLKKEVDEKQKKILKLDSQILKYHEKEQKEKRNSTNSNNGGVFGGTTPLSSSPSSSQSNIITTSSIPIPIKSTGATNPNTPHNSFASSTSPSSSFIKDSSDEDSSTPSSSLETPKFKNIFKKVKNESTKIINKAQKGINKHLNTEFFNPIDLPPEVQQQLQQQQQQQQNQKDSTPLSPPKFSFNFDEEKLKKSDDTILQIQKSPRDHQPIVTKEPSLSDLMSNENTFTTHFGSNSVDDKINNNNNNNSNNNSSNSDTNSSSSSNSSSSNGEINQNQINQDLDLLDAINKQQQLQEQNSIPSTKCIKEYSIKDAENKIGLRRAKKKPAPGATDMMEDVSFAFYPFENNQNLALFGVFDGHAGKWAAESASKLFPKQFAQILGDNGNQISKDMSLVLNSTFENVDNQMKNHEYEGCTATVSVIWKNSNNERYLQTGNLGDSSAFICRGTKAVELTFDHKASDPSERQRMIDSGIPVGEHQTRINGVAVSRSFGNHFIKEQDLGMIAIPHLSTPILLNDQDKFVIIASDGLWDIFNGQEAVDKALEKFEQGSVEMASYLLESAVQSSSCKDNVTVIVVIL